MMFLQLGVGRFRLGFRRSRVPEMARAFLAGGNRVKVLLEISRDVGRRGWPRSGRRFGLRVKLLLNEPALDKRGRIVGGGVAVGVALDDVLAALKGERDLLRGVVELLIRGANHL